MQAKKESTQNLHSKCFAYSYNPNPSFIILTANVICRKYRVSRSRKTVSFLLRLCASQNTERQIYLALSIIKCRIKQTRLQSDLPVYPAGTKFPYPFLMKWI
jgi:hypothetical protein